jgi:hypothetical protein
MLECERRMQQCVEIDAAVAIVARGMVRSVIHVFLLSSKSRERRRRCGSSCHVRGPRRRTI